MSDYSIIGLCTIISSAITSIGAIYKLSEYLKSKLNIKKANIRANIFKSGNSWTLRISNFSNCDIDANNIIVSFKNNKGFYTVWNCKNDVIPVLKKQEYYDIPFTLFIGAPATLSIHIKWKQGKKKFSYKQNIQFE